MKRRFEREKPRTAKERAKIAYRRERLKRTEIREAREAIRFSRNEYAEVYGKTSEEEE